MKKSTVSVFILSGLLSVFLSGCQKAEDPPVVKKETEIETGKLSSGLPFQFARMYGIIQSDYPVYELDTIVKSDLPQKEKTVSITSAICQKQELIVSMIMDDYETENQTAGDEDAGYAGRYRNDLWMSGEGLFLDGPGIPEAGLKPMESTYAFYSDYYQTYGIKRYLVEARFELPSDVDFDNLLPGCELRLLDFETPFPFSFKRVPQYESLEELAAREHGAIDTHDGISIICMGEKVEDGVLISWYGYGETKEQSISITYTPPEQNVAWPTISDNGREYPIKQLPANPYWENFGFYQLTEVKQLGRRFQCMFDVPENDQSPSYQVNIPGITFLEHEESTPVTLPVPEDYEELNQDIPFKEGSVRILGITRMKEPQTASASNDPGGTEGRERPAVYIDVTAIHEERNLALRRLICQRKLQWSGWENERYDFDETGSLSGFRIFYEEGDTSVTLKFHQAAFYWNQPFVMELSL